METPDQIQLFMNLNIEKVVGIVILLHMFNISVPFNY